MWQVIGIGVVGGLLPSSGVPTVEVGDWRDVYGYLYSISAVYFSTWWL